MKFQDPENELPKIFGFLLFVGMMAAGYYYNLTFIQLGLEDFGSRNLGLSNTIIARDMVLLAVLTCLIALGWGSFMQRRGWGRIFLVKLRIAFLVVLTQTLLTALLPAIKKEAGFILWLMGTSAALGVGVPAMFSLTVDLVPVKQRGLAAGLVTALAYFAAEVFSSEWTFTFFQKGLFWLLAAGSLGLGLVIFSGHPWLDKLASQHLQSEFAQGRFTREKKQGGKLIDRQLAGLIIIMFGIYFVDSLGFLRLLKVPEFMQNTWQSPILSHKLFIAGIHSLGALIGGVLYSALSRRQLFYWIFGIFALLHLMYSLSLRNSGDTTPTLALPMLYALAVSLYTVINFALWADLSTPDTICFNAALGVALSAWTATFLSTGLSIFWQGNGVSLEQHIQRVNGIAALFFIGLLALSFRKTKTT